MYRQGGKRNYYKLVRDNIIEIIESKGEHAYYHELKDDLEYLECLILKLQEEGNEILIARTKEEKIEELADFLEVIFTLATLLQIEEQELLCLGQKKELSIEDIYGNLSDFLALLPPSHMTISRLILCLKYALAIANKEQITLQDIFCKRNEKKLAKGGFTKRLFLERTEK